MANIEELTLGMQIKSNGSINYNPASRHKRHLAGHNRNSKYIYN